MYRGTTPTHTFYVDIDPELIKKIKITYSQQDKEVIVKRTEDCTIENNAITTRLTQEDTFQFQCKMIVEIQVRVLTTDGEVRTSDPLAVTVKKCLDEEVLK